MVRQGKVITAAGVSSGIDMALTLAAEIAGDETAQAIQLGIEYDPEPPLDSGSIAKAAPGIVQIVKDRRAAAEPKGPVTVTATGAWSDSSPHSSVVADAGSPPRPCT